MGKLELLLAPWRSQSDCLTPAGDLLIRHWPSEGSGAYLHELYAPIGSEQVASLQDRFGFSLPVSYADFLNEHNGARLFLNTISLSGVIDEVRRSVDPNDAQPVSAIDTLEFFLVSHSERWAHGWRRIGEITVNRQWSIELNVVGTIAVVIDDRRSMFTDIWSFLTASVDLLAPSFAGEPQRDIWDEIDDRLAISFERR